MSKFFSFIFKWSLVFFIWVGIVVAAILFYYYHDLPTLAEIEAQDSKQVIEVDYSNGNKINTLGDLYANKVTYHQLPQHLIDAVVATEDRKFFKHGGVDYSGIVRALYVDYKADRVVQGGSTITQQLAKLMFLKPERTVKRKIQEFLLALQLEKSFNKEQILTLYLNRAYFGAGNYGVASACRYYFGKSVDKINLNEAAMLAGLLKAPSKLSPNKNHDLAEKRANQVLANMIDAGYLSEKDIAEVEKPVNYTADHLQRFYFSDYVASQFADYLSADQKTNNNRFIVKTTLDEKLQNLTEETINSFIKSNQKKIGKAQIAVLLMSKDGAILALSGGKDYAASPFNRAIYSKRQAGSAFKTFVYLTALQNGFKTSDVMEDKKVKLGGWSPDNYEKKYYGQVSLKQAFAMSLNSVAVQLAAKLDKNQIIKNALRMGIVSDIDNNDATIALGTAPVTLLELTNSYATIANDGLAVLPYSVEKITGDKKGLLYNRKFSGDYKIIDEKDLTPLKEILRAVVENGTGKAANVAKNIYGKTGTSQNYRDAWFIGFNDKYVLGIWIGNDDNSATNNITGGSLPAQLFAKIIKKL